jgi:hypothetical protein
MINLLKSASKLMRETIMGKPTNKPKGKSVRHGNAPSPYTKYSKTPYVYSSAYHEWRRNRLAGRSVIKPVRDKTEYLKAAE